MNLPQERQMGTFEQTWSTRDAALAYALVGRPVFPLKPGAKEPLTPNGFKDATTDVATIRAWWDRWPNANVGGTLIGDEVVLDFDDETALAGLDLPPTMTAITARGLHMWYRARGVSKAKLTARVDRLVAGKGYVVFPPSIHPGGAVYRWSEDSPDELAPLPAWAMGEPSRQRGATEDVPTWSEGGRNDGLTRLVGAMRRAGLTLNEARDAALRANSERCAPPLPEREVLTIIRSAANWERWPIGGQRGDLIGGVVPPALAVIGLGDLLAKDLPPLRYAVEGLIPQGLSLLVAAPKIGKSWLANQVCVAVAMGAEVLGRPTRKGAALYLALEDGELRAQGRAQKALDRMGIQWAPGAVMDIAFNAERGDAMVHQVEEWLASNPDAALVVIDVLQKVRPVSSGRRSPYELDSEDVGRVLEITKRHPGLSILVVHHDRKQQATDFLDAVSGTHGISGSVDTILVMHRDRHSQQARIDVTGRDVDERTIYAVFDDGYWALDPLGGMTEEQREAYAWLEANGPAGAKAVADGLGRERTATQKLLDRMAGAGYVVKREGIFSVLTKVNRTAKADN